MGHIPGTTSSQVHQLQSLGVARAKKHPSQTFPPRPGSVVERTNSVGHRAAVSDGHPIIRLGRRLPKPGWPDPRRTPFQWDSDEIEARSSQDPQRARLLSGPLRHRFEPAGRAGPRRPDCPRRGPIRC